MSHVPEIVPFVPFVAADGGEAARLIDAAVAPLASVLAPTPSVETGAFRDAVVGAALERGGVAGVLFAPRWGGGGVMLT